MRGFFFGLLITTLIIGCRTDSQEIQHADIFKEPSSHNLHFVSFSTGIENPDNDRRSFYKVFIDKVEEGRTTTGLESQKKYFKTKLPVNRHVLSVEKWVLDEKAGKYVKLNNVNQPKPNFIYFEIPENRIVNIEMAVDGSGNAEYQLSDERD